MDEVGYSTDYIKVVVLTDPQVNVSILANLHTFVCRDTDTRLCVRACKHTHAYLIVDFLICLLE